MFHAKGLLYIAKGAVLASLPSCRQADVIHNIMQSANTWDSQKEVESRI